MRICMVLEGCYPYVRGGVSSWMHGLIGAMPQHEFVLWIIAESPEMKGKFKYEMHPNVKEVHEVFLMDALKLRPKRSRRNYKFTEEEVAQLRALISCEDPLWPILFRLYNKKKVGAIDFLMGEEFLNILLDLCREKYPFVSFAELFHTMRSMLLPMLFLMGQEVPIADVYHSTSTGYGGLLGSMGGWSTGRPFVVTEHGIYTREREEEILRAKWVPPYFKQQWISLFHMLSHCAYNNAATVTSLFPRASETQVEIGCPAYKCRVIANGINLKNFIELPLKEEDEYIDIAAVVRLSPIKDIKTMIYSFFALKTQVPNARLHILGDTDDENYAKECKQLVEQLGVKDLFFVGNTNVPEYLKKIDFTVLSSISEGQPLAVLESFAAARPCVTTDVGCCRELIRGYHDDLNGKAGIHVPPMHPEMLATAMELLCKRKDIRLAMGKAGRNRVKSFYVHDTMINNYLKNYEEVLSQWRELGLN
ncbi:MAG TPA: glycosyl transferase [Clostridiales bacterium]|nr:glycosyl transferase [Clostridiales bacterium]